MEYTMVPKSPETEFFYIHPQTGVITLAKVLSVEDRVYYRVRIIKHFSTKSFMYHDMLCNRNNH